MRRYIRITLIIMMLFTICACGKKSSGVSLEKNGELYQVADLVSFYYPKDFELDVRATKSSEVVEFIKDEQLIFYSMIQDDTDNRVEDMPELYQGLLEVEGASDVIYTDVEIESGLICQEFTGTYSRTGIKFKHMVYFTADATFVLGYQTTQDAFEENIEMISYYLDTLTVNQE